MVVKMVSLFCEAEIVHQEKLEADLSGDVTASCYGCIIIKSLLKYCPALTIFCVCTS